MRRLEKTSNPQTGHALAKAVTATAPVRTLRAWLPALVIGLAALLRIVHLATTWNDPYLALRHGDEQHYHLWAEQIVASGLVRHTAFFAAPLYAYVLAALYALGLESVSWSRGLNVVLGVGSVVLTWAVARRVTEPAWAWFSAALVAVSAPVLLYESFADKTSLTLFTTALAVYALVRAKTDWDWCAAGVAIAVAALAHPLLLTLAPAAALHGVVNRASRRALLALTLGTVLGVAPATVHNLISSGDLVLISSGGGMNLYVGNHAGNATGLYTSPAFARAELSHEEADYSKEAMRLSGRILSPAQTSRFWTRRALSEIAAAPALSFSRFVSRLRWTIGNRELVDHRVPEFYRPRSPVLRLPLPTFGLVAILGLLGGLVGFRERRLAGLSAFLVLYWGALSVFFVFGRLRLPLLVPLALLAGAVLPRFFGWVATRDRRAVWVVLLLPLSLLVFIGPSVVGTRDAYADHFNQAGRLYQERRFEAAAEAYQAALALRPSAVVHFYLAETLSQIGDAKGAQAHYAEALTTAEQQGAETLVYLGLARVKLNQARIAEARQILSLGIRARPDSADLYNNLGALEAGEGNLVAARDWWEKALAIDPFAPLALDNLARLSQQEGREAEAAKLYRRFLDATKDGEYPEMRERARASTGGR